MTIVSALKEQITAKGGDPANVLVVSDGIKKLTELETAENSDDDNQNNSDH